MVNPMSSNGPVQQEMESLLAAAFPDANFTLSNDSASHHGHMGDDGSGESHFTVEIEAPIFAGMSRLQRQRRGERPHRRACPAAAHGVRALRPGRARRLHLPALITGGPP